MSKTASTRPPGSQMRAGRSGWLQTWLYIIIWRPLVVLFLNLSTFLLSLPCFVLAIFSKDLASRTVASFWGRVNLWWSFVSISVSGREHMQPGQSYIVVSNHQSYYDIYALYGFSGIDLRFVMKQELRNIPVLGWICDVMGHIYLDRTNIEAAINSLQTAREKIAGGKSIVFFPEGTRSPDGRLQAFKRGAFKMAVELDLPILPVTLQGTSEILPAGRWDLFPGHIHLAIHPPISVAGLTQTDTRALMQDTHKQMQEYLGEDTRAGS